jgi:hypothetical protein
MSWTLSAIWSSVSPRGVVGGCSEPLLDPPELPVLPPELLVAPLLEPPLLEVLLEPPLLAAPLLLPLPPVDDPVSFDPPLPLEPEAVEPVEW